MPLAALLLCAAAPAEPGSLEQLGRREVVALHDFIEAWSNGTVVDDDRTYARFADALADDFVLISPDGETSSRAEIVAGFRAAHGRWADAPGRVSIEGIEVRAASDPYLLLTYREWHDLPAGSRGRASTVLLRREPDAPGGVAWVHLHEVWLGPDRQR